MNSFIDIETIKLSSEEETNEGFENNSSHSNTNKHKTDKNIQNTDLGKLPHLSKSNFGSTLKSMEPQLQCTVFEEDGSIVIDVRSEKETEEKINNGNTQTKLKVSTNGENIECSSTSKLRLEDDKKKTTVQKKKSKLQITSSKNEIKTDNVWKMRLRSSSSQKYPLSSCETKNKKKLLEIADSSNRKERGTIKPLKSKLPSPDWKQYPSLMELKLNCKKAMRNQILLLKKKKKCFTSTRDPSNKIVFKNNKTLKSKVPRDGLEKRGVSHEQESECRKSIGNISSLFVKKNEKSLSPRDNCLNTEKAHNTRTIQSSNNDFDKCQLPRTISDSRKILKNMLLPTESITRKKNLSPAADYLNEKKLKTKETMKSHLRCIDFEKFQFLPQSKLECKKSVKNISNFSVDNKICESLTADSLNEKYLENIKTVKSPLQSCCLKKSLSLSKSELDCTTSTDNASSPKKKKKRVSPTMDISNEKNCESVNTLCCQSQSIREDLSPSPKSKLKNKKSIKNVSYSSIKNKLEILHSNVSKQPSKIILLLFYES